MAAAGQGECPGCHSRRVVPVAYGLPGDELMRAAQAGRIKLGGCVVWEDAPNWHCRACAHEWRGPAPHPDRILAPDNSVDDPQADHTV